MASSSARRIKLSVNMRPFVSRVSRNGKAQKDFAVAIGRPVGQCVKNGVRQDMSGAEIHKVARDCARPYAGRSIKGAGSAEYQKKKTYARAATAREYFEIE